MDEYILQRVAWQNLADLFFLKKSTRKLLLTAVYRFSSAASWADGENTAMLPFRGVWGRKLLCGGYP